MIVSLIYIIFAALGLGVLIFIHELGHYYMARRVGMKVEAFGIGFGKPIYTWQKDGVEWRICWLPFGGYVKIAGMEKEGELEPHENPQGFFGKNPFDRIKVAFMGPFVNIVFAFLLFAVLWMTGGREKRFSEFTTKIGWVDPKSELYAKGVRPGDIISSYDGVPYQGSKDHLYAPMVAGNELDIQGLKVNYETGLQTPFDYKVKTYQHPDALARGIMTSGILNAANYVIYNPSAKGENAFPEGSPMESSGIKPSDRILWVDGVLIHSLQQLTHVLNDGKALLTIERDQEKILVRVPRVMVEELKLDSSVKDEIVDWQYEAELNSVKTNQLYIIPYNLSSDAVVQNELKFIDLDKQSPANVDSPVDFVLKEGDKILAVDGTPIKHSYQLLFQLQTHHVNIIVEQEDQLNKKISSLEADQEYDQEINWANLKQIYESIGTLNPVTTIGNLRLLHTITPKIRSDFVMAPEALTAFKAELLRHKKDIDAIEDPDKRAHAQHLLEQKENQLLLGLPGIQDRAVNYNPSPFELFSNVCKEIWRTLTALVTGHLNPKWMSGPVGIVQVVQASWMVSMKEAIFWLGAISLNLGILNLLPIPVLDGGYICLALGELITGKRVKTKTLEKVVIPFTVLLIAFFVYVTYHDIARIFSGLF